MSVDECITAYRKLAEEALPASYPKEVRALFNKSGYGFSEMVLRRALQRMVGEHTGEQDTLLRDDTCTDT